MSTKRRAHASSSLLPIHPRAIGLVGSPLLAALLCACTGTIGELGGDDENLLSKSNSVSAADGKSWAAPFLDTSTMRGDQSDWDHCHGKATCAPGEGVTGISVLPGGPGRTALCTQNGSFGGQVEATLTLDNGQDERRAKRAVNGDSDWAFGRWKLECGSGEYVSAVSEDANQCSGSNRLHAVQCSKGSGLRDDACSVRVFEGGDARGSDVSGDWDSGAFKGECAANEYVAGVSASIDTGAPSSILCCPTSGDASPPPTQPSPSAGNPFYAVSIDQGSWGPEQAKTVRDLGAGMIRLQFCNWPASKGELDNAVNTALNAGLAVHAELNYCTLPAYPNSAAWHQGFVDSGNDFAWAFTTAAQEIAAAFQGRVHVYEIWNEPNAAPRPNNFPTAFWPSADNANWDGSCTDYPYGADYGQDAWAICPRQLGVLTVNSFMAIRGADPGAKVVAGNVLYHGDNGWVAKEYWKQVEKSPAVDWFKNNKGGFPWDYVGIHPYAYRPTDGSLQAQIQDFKNIVASFGDPAKVALSEYGWRSGPADDGLGANDEGEQAQFLKSTFALAQQMDLAFVSWFNYLDGAGLTFGMRRADMSWKQAGRAYCEAAGASNCPAP